LWFYKKRNNDNLIFCIIYFVIIFVVSKPKPTPNATSTAAHPALMHPLAAGRKYFDPFDAISKHAPSALSSQISVLFTILGFESFDITTHLST